MLSWLERLASIRMSINYGILTSCHIQLLEICTESGWANPHGPLVGPALVQPELGRETGPYHLDTCQDPGDSNYKYCIKSKFIFDII